MQLGLFSVSYAGYWGQESLGLEDFILRAAQLGFDCVMLAGKRPHLAPVDMSEGRLEKLQKTLREAKISCAVVAAYTDLCLPASAEVPQLEWQIHYVSELGRWGACLGARYVRVFTGYSAGPLSPHAQWTLVVRALQEMADRLAEYRMTLAIQNHHDLAVHTDALLELLADVNRPNCKLAFDAWSPFLRGENLYESARKAAPHTVITTNADYIRLPRFAYDPSVVNYRRVEPDFVRAVPFGQGEIPFEAFFRGLRDGGFDGVASYEMCSPIRGGGSLQNLDAYARIYLDWMRSHVLQ